MTLDLGALPSAQSARTKLESDEVDMFVKVGSDEYNYFLEKLRKLKHDEVFFIYSGGACVFFEVVVDDKVLFPPFASRKEWLNELIPKLRSEGYGVNIMPRREDRELYDEAWFIAWYPCTVYFDGNNKSYRKVEVPDMKFRGENLPSSYSLPDVSHPRSFFSKGYDQFAEELCFPFCRTIYTVRKCGQMVSYSGEHLTTVDDWKDRVSPLLKKKGFIVLNDNDIWRISLYA